MASKSTRRDGAAHDGIISAVANVGHPVVCCPGSYSARVAQLYRELFETAGGPPPSTHTPSKHFPVFTARTRVEYKTVITTTCQFPFTAHQAPFLSTSSSTTLETQLLGCVNNFGWERAQRV
ncbi:hypothetical protein Y032_0031g2266 [Ancylostoma ceylanicum]|uniref:Uncharacterized protein n=1 Tax=Ancylostoma ceylanicum TaxID=53326 RepID=A0A016URH4_9BILA|nr:hypothetical protein Y032_0031g2266 [Ancylostoma ceylanicum]